MRVVALDHVQVSCPAGGEEVARTFYAQALGLVEIAKPPVLARRGGVWFQGPGFQVHVGVETPFAPARKAHPAFAVDDLPGAAERLSDLGFAVRWDDAIRGVRRLHTADGHGNRVELQQG